MDRRRGVGMLAAGVCLWGGVGLARAAPARLPTLGWTLELPATPTWTVEPPGSMPQDVLTTREAPVVKAIVARAFSSCGDWLEQSSEGFVGRLEMDGAVAVAPAWVPAGWLPATVTYTAGFSSSRVLQLCRDLDEASGALGVTIDLPAGVEAGVALRGLLAAIDVELVRRGVPPVDYGTDAAGVRAVVERRIRSANAAAVAARGPHADDDDDDDDDDEAAPTDGPRVAAADAPRATAAVEARAADDRAAWSSSPPRGRDGDDDRPPTARFDGVRATLELATLSLEGDGVDGGGLFGAALAVPPRYRRGPRKAGWVYAGRVAIGKVSDALVGHGHLALGGAIGHPRKQLAVLMVLGADRTVEGSLFATQDASFAGLQALLRLPVTPRLDLEACATAIAGSQGRESWLELSLVSVRLAALAVIVGVERRTWDDGMSSLGARIGVGF